MYSKPHRHSLVLLIATALLSITAGCGLVKSLGRNPVGEDLVKIEKLSNYKNGQFQNPECEDAAVEAPKSSRRFLSMFNRPSTIRPSNTLPWKKTDLRSLKTAVPTVTWFGHSSLLIQTREGNVLTDPIFSGHAGPVPGLIKAFKGSDHYKAKDLPSIDVLIISHDHYDHLDYSTVKKLKAQIKMVVVPVGVGSHFIYWGFDPKKIIELNWDQSVSLPGGLIITATPARHRSNRTFVQNKTLWASYVIQAGDHKLFYSGDGGYGTHFKTIGERYGPFDLALMECGQYSPNWAETHMTPDQTAQAGIDLQSRMIQPVHWAKFAESDHPWNEPVKLLLTAAERLNIEVNVPLIGEAYRLGSPVKHLVWWDFE